MLEALCLNKTRDKKKKFQKQNREKNIEGKVPEKNRKRKQIHIITETDVMKMNDDIVHHLLYDYYLMNNQVYPLVLLLMLIDEVDFHSVMLKYLLLVWEILFHLNDNDINLLEVVEVMKKILLLMNDVHQEYFLQLNHWYH